MSEPSFEELRQLAIAATREIRALRGQIAALKAAGGRQVAIVGMGCRFPGGADTPNAFWSLLERGVDAIEDIPRERWEADRTLDVDPHRSARQSMRQMGVVQEVDRFDPAFFGISPKEAARMDPQQRLLLEVAWEALERACIAPGSLRGTHTGVYLGIATSDYARVTDRISDIDAFTATGTMPGVAAGRLSYVLGLEGPSMVVDTACSSSLVALHLACESLRCGESEVALAGGVSLMLTPDVSEAVFHLRAASPSGRCRTFSADADGYVRSEGCGVLVLKTLAAAQRDKNPILAIIRGTAVNQDGRSNGLTAPNGQAQRKVIRQALDRAGVPPNEISYVEAHGTGTPLGDPIELHALGDVFGNGRAPNDPLIVGSVKTNIGHLEAAAGVAGVMKVVLSMQRGVVPPHLHFERPSSEIEWRRLPIVVPSAGRPWERLAPRKAGVSSFGFSGTNAHVVLEDAPTSTPIEHVRGPDLFSLSARSLPVLRKLAARVDTHLRSTTPKADLAGLCAVASRGRDHFEHRAAIVADDVEGLRESLARLAAGQPDGSTSIGEVRTSVPRTAMLFTGQGFHWVGMGVELFDAFPHAREVLQRCNEALREVGQDQLSALWAGDDARLVTLLEQPSFLQPALFSLEVALAELWGTYGLKPDIVLGHSLGEYAAACVAGVFSVEEGAQLLFQRARLIEECVAPGCMFAVTGDPETVDAMLSAVPPGVYVAARNGPGSATLAGDAASVANSRTAIERAGMRVRDLPISVAYHTPWVEPALERFGDVLRSVSMRKPRIDLISNVSGRRAGDEIQTADYWCDQMRQTVAFDAGVRTLLGEPLGAIVEVGPQPGLLPLVREVADSRGGFAATAAMAASMRRGRSTVRTMLKAGAELYVRGVLSEPPVRQRLAEPQDLPTYPFENERYWVPRVEKTRTLRAASSAVDVPHTLQVEWIPRPLEPLSVSAPTTGGHWVVVACEDPNVGEDSWISECWRERGTVTRLQDSNPALLGERLEAVFSDRTVEGVIFTGRAMDPACARSQSLALLRTIQILARHGTRLWVITRGAHAVRRSERCDPFQAALWGLARVAFVEHPALKGGLCDLSRDVEASTEARAMADMIHTRGAEPSAWRRGQAYVQRLVPDDDAGRGCDRVPVMLGHAEGAYLVTGGLGALGFEVTRKLLSQGGGEVVVVGRSPLDPKTTAAARMERLHAEGTGRVRYVSADVADRAAMVEVFRSLQKPLRGIVHAAGANAFGPLAETSPDLVDALWRGKVEGAWTLHELSSTTELDFFVCFGSAAGVWGSREQGIYSATNQFLDGLAWLRRAQGRVATTCDWGFFADGGMRDVDAERRFERVGLHPMRTDQMISWLEAPRVPAPQWVVVAANWSRLRDAFTGTLQAHLFDARVDPDLSARSVSQGSEPILPTLRDRGQVAKIVLERIAEVFGFDDPRTVPIDRGFSEMGLDSIMALELRAAVSQGLGVPLSATVAFDHPTVEQLVQHVVCDVLSLETPEKEVRPETSTRCDESIAIVGTACQLPAGIVDLDGFWSWLLAEGDAVGRLSPRWSNDAEEDEEWPRWGSVLPDIAAFDPRAFNITPREAKTIDPQHRLLLQGAWHALEDAGIPLRSVRESDTGVFVGVGVNDYSQLCRDADPDARDPYVLSGNNLCFAAGRISHHLGLRGPSYAVDTACSSSLAAIHLACESLRRHECTSALAGGVNVLSTPRTFAQLSRLNCMSATGRCRTFDAAADGYVRGEGMGMLVLKRLSDAEREGHRILAVIRGSAVNHDGYSSGLTVPSGPAQQRVLREALSRAGVAPQGVDYIEAHGTGTSLGDPIELAAIAAVLDVPDRDRPLVVSSVKTNLGHLEAASGVVGLMKVVGVVRHRRVPAHLHFEAGNPNVPWSTMNLRIPTSTEALTPRDDRPIIAGVSAFGMSGTNVHIVVEGVDERGTQVDSIDLRPAGRFLPLSARSLQSLQMLAQRYEALVSGLGDDDALERLCRAAARQREVSFEYRAVVRASTRGEAREELRKIGDPDGGSRGVFVAPRVRRMGFVFTDHGSPWVGMGRELDAHAPVFREVIDKCDNLLRPSWKRPLREVLFAGAPSEDSALYIHTALFSMQCALVEQWRSWGVEADVVLGYGVGEYAAAYAAGVFDLRDGLDLIQRQGAQRGVPRGDTDAGRGVDPMLDAFEREVGHCQLHVPAIPIISSVIATPDGESWHVPSFHRRQVLEPVHFEACAAKLAEFGCDVLLEIGPKSTLLDLLAELERFPTDRVLLQPSMRAGVDALQSLREAAASLHTHGIPVDLGAVLGPISGPFDLPLYPFETHRYWIESPMQERTQDDRSNRPLHHPWLSERVADTDGKVTYVGTIALPAASDLADHVVAGEPVFPASGYVELGLAVAADLGVETAVTNLAIGRPLALQLQQPMKIHVVAERGGDGWEVTIRTSDHAGEALVHASLRVADRGVAGTPDDVLPARANGLPLSVDDLYADVEAAGLRYGPAFRGLSRLRLAGDCVHAEIALPECAQRGAYRLHPVLLDASFQALGALVLARGDTPGFVPIGLDRMRLFASPPEKMRVRCHIRTQGAADLLRGDLECWSEQGTLVARVEGLQLAKMRSNERAQGKAEVDLASMLSHTAWHPVALAGGAVAAAPGRWIVIGASPRAKDLVAALRERGADVISVAHDDGQTLDASLRSAGPGTVRGVVHWVETPSSAGTDPWRAQPEIAMPLVATIGAMSSSSAKRLWIISEDAQTTASSAYPLSVEGLAQSSVWGLGRVAFNECPELRCTNIDLAADTAMSPLVAELLADRGEDQIALHGTVRYVRRLEAGEAAPVHPRDAAVCEKLVVQREGLVETLLPVAVDRPAVAPDDIEIEVSYAGVNFRDVLTAMGMIRGHERGLGCECVGKVLRVGDRVDALRVGDRVMAVAPGAFASHVSVDHRMATALPEAVLSEDAATLPLAFSTALYGLLHLAGLRRGQRVLIHAAAGGVGMAAVQVAQQVGAEVFATASPAKWDAVRAMGVERVWNSRTPEFGPAIREITSGMGVDVVLNALTGEMLQESLALVRPGGVFLEMGKTERLSPEQLQARAPEIRYVPFDLRDVSPEQQQALLRTVLEGLTAGSLRPLPRRVVPFADGGEALRFMSRARHIGKIVLHIDAPPDTPVDRPSLRRDGSYLVTGGLGALGMVASEWLLTQQVGRVVLASRNSPDVATQAQIEQWRRAGHSVEVVSTDVHDEAALQACIEACESDGLVLRGVIHAAGVLADGALTQATWPDVERVMVPKVAGGWLLHRLTEHRHLDFLLFYGSVASLVGGRGQASYAAANAFLDALAMFRRQRNLPALSVQWGPWSDVGMAARLDPTQRDRIAARGVGFIDAEVARASFPTLLSSRSDSIAVCPLDRERMRASHEGGPIPSLLGGGVVVSTAKDRFDDTVSPWVPWLRSLTTSERRPSCIEAVCEVARGVMGEAQSPLEPHMPLMDAGLDSLMAIEFRNRIAAQTGLSLPASLLFDHPTAVAVADLVLERLGKSVAGDVPATVATHPRLASRPVDLGSLQASLAEALPSERSEICVASLRAACAQVMELAAPEDVATDAPLMEAGLDSLMAVELRNRISRATGLSLPASILFDYPTLDALAGHVLAQLRLASRPSIHEDKEAGLDTRSPARGSRIAAVELEMLASTLGAALPSERKAICEAALAQVCARIMELPADVRVPHDAPLMEAGLDSLMAVEMRNRVSRSTGLRLAASILFDYPTLDALAEHVVAQLNVQQAAQGRVATEDGATHREASWVEQELRRFEESVGE